MRGQWTGFDLDLPPVCLQLLLGEEDSSLLAHLSGPVQVPLSLCILGVWDPSPSSAREQRWKLSLGQRDDKLQALHIWYLFMSFAWDLM